MALVLKFYATSAEILRYDVLKYIDDVKNAPSAT